MPSILIIITDNLSGLDRICYLLLTYMLEVVNFACGIFPRLFHPLGSGTIPLAGIMHDITGKHYS